MKRLLSWDHLAVPVMIGRGVDKLGGNPGLAGVLVALVRVSLFYLFYEVVLVGVHDICVTHARHRVFV